MPVSEPSEAGEQQIFDVTSLHHRRAVQRWERTSVGDLLERLTWSTPDQDAIVGRPGAFADTAYRRLTYRQADELANRVANGLLARGLQRGDVVMMFCENSVEAYLSKIALAKSGLVCAAVNPAMAPDMIASMVQLTEPAAAIVDAELWPRAEAPFTAGGVEVAVTIPFGGGAVAGSVTFAEFEAGQPSSEPVVEIHGDDIWEILFTSGTTAMPKGVMISHSSSYLCAYGFAVSLTRGLAIESDLRTGTGLPMIYHIGSQIFTFSTFLCGGTVVLDRRPDPQTLAQMVDEERVTALWAGSPAMVAALDATLTAQPHLDVTSLGVVVYGWSALPPTVLASMKRHCGTLTAFEIFGQTESISCHRFWPDKWAELYERTAPQDNYVGIPNPLLASTVVDPDGADLAHTPGVAGEAVYRSPSMMAGYYRDPEATRIAFRGGWFHSGDSCAYDADGLRVMLDRYKDIVKTGGENVSSLRVEAVLNQHPAVAKAVIIGLPHERWGEAVTAVVLTDQPGDDALGAELIAWCRARLAGYETPKSVLFVDALPETIGGKVLKYKLRAAHAGTYAAPL